MILEGMTEASVWRVHRALTCVGRRHFEELRRSGLSPRAALRRINMDSKEDTRKREAQQRQIFIETDLRYAQMSVAEFQEYNADCFFNRWEEHTPAERLRIMRRYGAKDPDVLRRIYLEHEQRIWFTEDSFNWLHKDLIQKALEYGLDVNREAAAAYKIT
jgi:hypothetical protein